MVDDITTAPSGRFIVRIDPELHAALRAGAARAGVSMNEYCARKLASPASAIDRSGFDVVRHAMAVVGSPLVGVVVFGSWSRGKSGPGSDVDLLLIVEDEMELTRGLYQRWDEAPIQWHTHPVEPHFVHLPAEGARLSGLWAEVALDGLVLHERDREVSRRLVSMRHEIASGRHSRRSVQGQTYWVDAGP